MTREHAKPRGKKSPLAKLEATDHLPGIDDREHVDRHGAEGNAFQVNDHAQTPVRRSPDHRHGAEGNAFQVNDQPTEGEA